MSKRPRSSDLSPVTPDGDTGADGDAAIGASRPAASAKRDEADRPAASTVNAGAPPRRAPARPPSRQTARRTAGRSEPRPGRAVRPRRERHVYERLKAAATRTWAWMRTARGAAISVGVALLVVGLGGLLVITSTGPGAPQLRFADADGSAAAIRVSVMKSIRQGELGRSLAPRTQAAVAQALRSGPMYFLSAVLNFRDVPATGPTGEAILIPRLSEGVAVSERVAFVNTSKTRLRDVRMSVLAPSVGSRMAVTSAKVDGRGTDADLRGNELVVALPAPLPPGGQSSVDLVFRLYPRRLDQAAALPQVIGGGGSGSTGPDLQLERQNLILLLDWYPRMERLADSGWTGAHVVPDAADFSGPAGTVEFDVTLPASWQVMAGGHVAAHSQGASLQSERVVLAGSRALGFVAMRNGVESSVSKGDYAVRGLSLDTYRPAMQGAVENGLFAKASLSQKLGIPAWRDTVLVATAFQAPQNMLVADNLVLFGQAALDKAAPAAGPGSESANYRQNIFDGVAAEWWGGRVDTNGTALPGLRDGIRAWSAQYVWSAMAGPTAGRLDSSVELADPYRSARDQHDDVVATLPYVAVQDPPALAIAASKGGLVYAGLAMGLAPGVPATTAVDTLGAKAFTNMASPEFATSLDVGGITAAYQRASGRSGQDVESIVRTWLEEKQGDAEIGLKGGQGTITPYTDTAAASRDLGQVSFTFDLDNVTGAGPGWGGPVRS